MGYCPWGCKDLDMSERLTLSLSYHLSIRIEIKLYFLLIEVSLPLWFSTTKSTIFKKKNKKKTVKANNKNLSFLSRTAGLQFKVMSQEISHM